MMTFECEVCRTDGKAISLSSTVVKGYVILPQALFIIWCSNCGTVKIIADKVVDGRARGQKECWLLVGGNGESWDNIDDARKCYLETKEANNPSKPCRKS